MKNIEICHSWRGMNLAFISWRSIISILLLGSTLVDALQTKNIHINGLNPSNGKSDNEQAGKVSNVRVISKAPDEQAGKVSNVRVISKAPDEQVSNVRVISKAPDEQAGKVSNVRVISKAPDEQAGKVSNVRVISKAPDEQVSNVRVISKAPDEQAGKVSNVRVISKAPDEQAGKVSNVRVISKAPSIRSENRQHNKNIDDGGPKSGVQLDVQENHVVMDNGLVQVNLSNPDGLVTTIRYKGNEDNLLEVRDAEDSRGYWDVVWGEPGQEGIFDKLKTTQFKVIVQNANQVEISFIQKWDSSLKGKLMPVNLEKRYIMLRGSSGFYTYAIFDHLKGWPDFELGEARIAFKLSEDKFHHMTITDDRQRTMPSFEDRKNGQPLAYPEAVLLTNPSNPTLKGEVDDKYQYSMEDKDNGVHGWISLNPRVGFWMITPSNEFRTGGPHKQDLTSHAGPTTLAMFISSHYTGEELAPKFQNGEPWKKVFGPVFIYLNSVGDTVKDPYKTLWADAKAQFTKEVQSWPYSFPASEDFPRSDQRGTITGKLLVRDRYVRQNDIPANSAYVGLAPPGDVGSWQTECKGYQFWTKADANGLFSITNIRAGDYNLFAWVPGFIGDYKYNISIKITPGSNKNLGNLVFEPPRNGPTIWEIGVADRSAAEFKVPQPAQKYINKLYVNRQHWFRQYGLWEQYSELYPTTDLVYTIGVSKHWNDWFFAHVPRKLKDGKYVPATWKIVFKLGKISTSGTYKLQLALASATYAELQVRINDPKVANPHFTTGRIGKDNAIARHGIHGLYWLFSIDVPGTLLRQGENTIFLSQTRVASAFYGFLYDYIRFEGPPR